MKIVICILSMIVVLQVLWEIEKYFINKKYGK